MKPTRTIANLYYPVKYTIVHIIFFGFTLDPVLIVARGTVSFNWFEVINALWNFRIPFAHGFNFGSVWVFVIMCVPYAVILLWSLRYVFIFVLALFPLLRYLNGCRSATRCRRHVKLDKQVQIHNGAPGSGKTRLLVLLADILSELMWRKLSWLYWRDFTKPKTTETEREDWNEIEESYNYYTTQQNGATPIRCLFSNIGIEKDGHWSSKLTFEHAAQLERVPSYTISLFSEFGTTYNIEYSHDKLLQMSDDLRFCRQFRENVILGDEQDASNISIDARRVVSDVWYMTECKPICKPWLLSVPFGMLKFIFAKTQRCKWRWLSKSMCAWENLINQIGFVKFRYIAEGNTEHTRTNKGDKFLAKLTNPIRYDTRAFRKLADCRHRPFMAEIHTTLEVENTPAIRQAYLRAEFKNRPEVFYTNTNEDEMMYLQKQFSDKKLLAAQLAKWREKYPEEYAEFRAKYNTE